MPQFSYDRYDRRRPVPARRTNNSLFGFWVPVVVTSTLAAGALAAWVLAARDDNEHSVTSDDEDLSYGGDTDREQHRGSGGGVGGASGGARPPSYGVSEGVVRGGEGLGDDDNSLLGRVQSTIRRTPSPQQLFDGASKKVVAGVAAAGAAVGGALSAIREDREDDFADHERWREPGAAAAAAARSAEAGRGNQGGRRRTVAIVVSADEGGLELDDSEEKGWKTEQASLLSHIPHVGANVNLLVLIYTPRHQDHPSTSPSSKPTGAPSSLASSYSAINTPAPTPGDELASMDPMPVTPALSARSSGSSSYDLLHRQAARLVHQSANILPFSTPGGFVHMLKHVAPDVVYVAESLAGERGASVEELRGWLGQIVVVVGEGGAGLVDDTEDEAGGNVAAGKQPKWWETSQYVGLGKGIEIVDAVRVSDDWERRVGGRE